jgi:hypothetical protein
MDGHRHKAVLVDRFCVALSVDSCHVGNGTLQDSIHIGASNVDLNIYQ